MLTKRSAHQKLSFFLFSIFSVFFTTVAVQLRCPRLHSRLQKRERTTHRACFSPFVFSIFHFQCFLYYSCCTGALLSTAQSVCKKESALARPTTPPHPHSVKRLLCFSKRHFAERHSVVLFLYASFSAVPLPGFARYTGATYRGTRIFRCSAHLESSSDMCIIGGKSNSDMQGGVN